MRPSSAWSAGSRAPGNRRWPCMGLAHHLGAAFLRLDAIRDGLFRSELRLSDAKDGNYAVARALAAENLSLGYPVVVDRVHWDRALHDGWRDKGARIPCRLIWAEINCSDAAERRARVEFRAASGRKGWNEIGHLKMDPVAAPDIRLDTAGVAPEASLSQRITAVERLAAR